MLQTSVLLPVWPISMNTSDLTYHWLEIWVEQHISIGVHGKVISVWSKLEQKRYKKGEICKRKSAGDQGPMRNMTSAICVQLTGVCSYSEARRQPLDVFQGHVNGHDPQDELVLKLLSFLKEKQWGQEHALSPDTRLDVWQLTSSSVQTHLR